MHLWGKAKEMAKVGTIGRGLGGGRMWVVRRIKMWKTESCRAADRNR